MKIQIQRAEPSPALHPFVDHYKYIQADLSGVMKPIPIAQEELYFNNIDIRIHSPGYFDLYNPKVHIAGLMSCGQETISEVLSPCFGGGFAVIFRPGGIEKLFHISSADISRYAIRAEVIFGNGIMDLREQIRTLTNIAEKNNRFNSGSHPKEQLLANCKI